MDRPGGITSNHQCSDPNKCLTADKRPAVNSRSVPTPWWPQCSATKAETVTTWFPRLLSWYPLTEGAHWSRRLNADVNEPPSANHAATNAYTRPVAARQTACGHVGRDYYGREDADTAFLRRRPVSFVIFGKPGLPTDRVAAALSAYWGCVHVSVAIGLATAGGQVAVDLRRGLALNAAQLGNAGSLVGLLGLESPRVRQRGYVLTGLPRHDPESSVYEQMSTVFVTNPPDVVIYMSCPDVDLHAYRDGLILESTKHDYLTQTLHPNGRDFHRDNTRYVHWHKSWRKYSSADLELKDYVAHSLNVVEEIVKRFDSAFVITIDGRRPVDELFETIKARLLSMPLQYTVMPKIVRNQDEKSTVSLENRGESGVSMSSENEDLLFESESYDMIHNGLESETDLYEATDNEELITNDTSSSKEHIRLLSEFGRLCPVSFFRGSFRLGSQNHCVKFMGKLYYFAGSEELHSFYEHPTRFMDVPRPALLVRAIFYGPQKLSGPAAKSVGHFFGYDLIDVDYIRKPYEERSKQTYVSTIVKTILKTAYEVMKIKDSAPSEIAVMRNAIGDWIQLYFGTESDSPDEESNDSGREILEDDLDNETQDSGSDKKRQFMSLKSYFESYGVDFMFDLNACKRAYDEPETLNRYFQNMSKRRKSIFKLNFLTENKTDSFQLIDFIVNAVRIKNEKNKNWIIVNAPLDFQLIKKLNSESLNPIQMVFFHDADPMHNVLLSDKLSDVQYYKINRETFENVENGMRHGTIAGRTNYTEFVGKIENTMRRDEYQFAEEDEEDIEEYDDEYGNDNNLSHDLLMEVILPEIIERINQYTENLLVQWHVLRTNVANEMNSVYVDLNVIECKPDPTMENAIKILIEDTLYYVKKFLSENVYDVSTTTDNDDDDTTPIAGRYDGDTSVYCPVMFARGKLSVGSKKHVAVYQNRYYYMKSAVNLRAFMADPSKYASFAVAPEINPKPKISLYFPFGVDATDSFRDVFSAFDLTPVDWYKVFKRRVLPADTPALGKMYEEPAFRRDIVDKFFVTSEKNNVDRVNGLRKYVDRESARLDDVDWAKMNSVFSPENDEGICYTNCPTNLTELKYLNENQMSPDVVVQVRIADERWARDLAKRAVAKNWLTYRYALIETVVAQDEATRRKDVADRSALFKSKLAQMKREKEIDRVGARLKRIIQTMATETEHGPDAMERLSCDDLSDENRSTLSSSSSSGDRLRSRFAELTLRQKKIIIQYGLGSDDFSDLDDFTALDRIDETISDEIAKPEWLMSRCFSGYQWSEIENRPQLDATVEEYTKNEKKSMASMREFAESSGVPWLTVQWPVGNGDDRLQPTIARLLDDLRSVLDVGGGGGAPETAYSVDVGTADEMLRAGEAHLSRFGRACPVQARRRPDSVPRAHAKDLADGRAFPVLYRQYVYYTSGPEHRDEFVRRPLEYARGPCTGAVGPLRLAVLGPPRSGKSRRARELCERHGLQPIRVDEKLLRAYFAECGWTSGADPAWRRLHRGGALDDVTLAAAVAWAAQGVRAAVQGFVLDGYPVTENQFRLLDKSGVLLHRMFVLNGRPCDQDHDDDSVPRNGQKKHSVSAALSRHRSEVWTRESAAAGPWLSDRYGDAVVTVTAVTGHEQNVAMDASVFACVRALREYGARALAGLPCRLAGLPVPEIEWRAKMSAYLDVCPVCRTDDGLFTRPGNGRRTARDLTQYGRHVYCVCPRHRDAFLADPRRYADAAPDVPEPLPERLTAAATRQLQLQHQSGGGDAWFRDTCVVCALARPWRPARRRGDVAFAARYSKHTFLFCSAACRRAFSRRPRAYSEYETRACRPIDDDVQPSAVHRLPVPGYLEQTVSEHVARALVQLTAARPVYPGLSANVTAAVFVGLYVGANGGADRQIDEYYRRAYRRFVEACHGFKSEVFRLKLSIL